MSDEDLKLVGQFKYLSAKADEPTCYGGDCKYTNILNVRPMCALCEPRRKNPGRMEEVQVASGLDPVCGIDLRKGK